MNNRFEIRGDEVIIFLDRRGGETLEARIDVYDLEKVNSHPGKWIAMLSKGTGTYYVASRTVGDRKNRKTILLHRFVLEPPPGMVVDHINHDALDNRRSNLRVVTHAQNCQNKRGASRANKSSGVLGVSWHKKSGKWRAHARVDGKNHYLGYFETIEEAEEKVAEFRAKFIPYSREAVCGGSRS